MPADASTVVAIPVARRIDRAVWLCPLILLLEGYDIAAIGYAIPSLVDAWKIPPSGFTQVLTAGNVGLMLGSFAVGLLGDRLGRKPVLIVCVFLFGAVSLLSAFVVSPLGLAALRLVTGFGLGGGLPSLLALASEVALDISPQRFVTLVNVGVPIGFSAGGLLASWLVRVFKWQAIFIVGGILPLALLPFLVLWLGDSIPARSPSHRQGLRALFRNGLASSTLLLWGSNALSYLSLYLILLWTPALLHSTGISAPRAILASVVYGLGAIVCPVLTGMGADTFGLERVLMYGLVLGALAILSIGLLEPPFCLLSLLLFTAGIGAGCQAGLNSLSALTYPQRLRSTGAGWALGVGRIGSIAGPLLGGLLLSFGISTRKVFVAASIPVFGAAAFVTILGRFRQRHCVDSDSTILADD